DTNGGNNTTTSNPLSVQYAPLQQLFTDLANDKVADYNWISPNQYNDMHTSLTGGYKGLTGDAANIKQGDDFLSQIVPVIMASNADGVPYASPVNFTHSSDLLTMQEIFRVGPPLLGDAANSNDLSDLFAPG